MHVFQEFNDFTVKVNLYIIIHDLYNNQIRLLFILITRHLIKPTSNQLSTVMQNKAFPKQVYID